MLWYKTQIEPTREEFRLNTPSRPLQEMARWCLSGRSSWLSVYSPNALCGQLGTVLTVPLSFQPASLFHSFFFFFSPFPLGTSLPEQKTHASETLMQWDANIGLHHMILGVVLRKLVFLEVVRQQKSTLGLTPENWPYSSDACSRPQFHTLIQGQPERPAWLKLKRALQTLTSEASLPLM